MSENEIRPALTPEEWAELDVDRDILDSAGWRAEDAPRLRLTPRGVTIGESEAPQMWVASGLCPALAALALQHAAPDGGPLFTWNMVQAIREVAAEARSCAEERYNDAGAVEFARFASLAEEAAERLASLLPPRTDAERPVP